MNYAFSTEPTDLNIIMKRICFIAQFPPPIHGLSKAVATLYSSTLQSKYLFRQVDTTNNRKILQTLWKIATHKSDLFLFYYSTNTWRKLARPVNIKVITMEKKQMSDSSARRILSHLNRKKTAENYKRSLNYQAISHVSGTIILGNSLKNIFKGMINEKKYSSYPTALMKNIC